MENGRPVLGLEDGTIDVERLLVEPQDGHVSMDSVMCFNKKIPKNTMEMVDVSCRFGASGTGSAKEGEDILNGEVLDAMPSEVDVGYLRLHDEFCSMGDEYLLGVQFAESITNLDYGSTEALQAPFPDSQMQVSGAGSGSGSTCKSDRFRKMEVLDCKNNQFNYGCSELSDIPSYHECEMLIGEEPSISPRSFSLQNIGKFHNSSSYSFEDILSDENNGRQSALGEMFCSPKTENSNEFELAVQDGETCQRQETLATTPVQANCTDILPTQKRSRKPTQRYIDELADPFSTNSKKRREVSSSTLKVKDKSLRVKDHKKCHMGTRAIRLPAEESSVMAIQVPFASLAHNECPKDHLNSKGKRSAPENQKKRDESITAVYLKKDDYVTSHKKGDDYVTSRKKRDDFVTNRKKGDDYVTSRKKGDDYVTSRKKGDDFVIAAANLKKRDDHAIEASQKKKNDCTGAATPAANLKKREDRAIEACQKKKNDFTDATTPKKRDKHLKHASGNKRDDCDTSALHEKKSENSLTDESPEEVSAFRKHHRLWTIAEVRKLIDGVSQYGVGRWSRIKKLFFATSAHRTSVDLKDKWRNLLKASGGIQEQGNQQGEKKRNMAWRPLPKSILRRVCELSAMYPYPKGQRPKKITDNNNNNNYNSYNESPDRSTDITLSDYRRILRSVDDN
ncbi:hypothetical protein ABFS82_12G141500 [Erythranthe guttata]